MPRLGTSCRTDYKHVDGTETVTLMKGDETLPTTVAYAKRGMLTKTDVELFGSQAGSLVFDLPAAEVAGDITTPLAGMKIVDADGNTFSVNGVPYLPMSQIWHCICSPDE